MERPKRGSRVSSLSSSFTDSCVSARHRTETANSSFDLSPPPDGDAFIDIPLQVQSEMLASLHRTVDSVLDSMTGDRPSDNAQWKFKTEKKGITYYVDNQVRAGQYRFCCVSETRASVEDVIKLFLIPDTTTLLRHCRILYDNVQTARLLNVLEPPTHQNPYRSTYLRYTALKAPKLMDDRDMCLAVATDLFTDTDGSTVGYCLWDSVEIPEYPDLHGMRGIVRSRMFKSGYFCRRRNTLDKSHGSRQAAAATTEIVYFAGIEAGGIAPRLASWLVMERFGANVLRLCDHFRRAKLDPATFRPRVEWPSTRFAYQCRDCCKKFGSLSKRVNCGACGEVFCATCYVKRNVDLPGAGVKSVRFCLGCLDERGVDTAFKPRRSTVASKARNLLRRSDNLSDFEQPDSEFYLQQKRSTLASRS